MPDVLEMPVGDEIPEISPKNRAGAMISLSLGKYSRPPRLPPTPTPAHPDSRPPLHGGTIMGGGEFGNGAT